MDSFDDVPIPVPPPVSTSSSNPAKSALKRKAEDGETLDIVTTKRVCFSGPHFPQSCFLPDSIIYQILKNPSSAYVWEKLAKTCKYFFAKNPVVVFASLDHYYAEWRSFFNGTAKCIDVTNVAHKIWVADQILIKFTYPYSTPIFGNLVSTIVPKLYKCDAKYLELELQALSYQEFVMLAAKAEDVLLKHSSVTHEDGLAVSIEKLIEPLTKLKCFHYDGELEAMMTFKSFAELVKLSHFSSIDAFTLMNVPDNFDIEAFRSYMRTNKRTEFDLSFHSGSHDYQNRLESLVDEVIVGIAEHNYPHILIYFNGIDEEKYEKMRSAYYFH